MLGKIVYWFRSLILALICGYQRYLSPFLGNRCRFYPSCSDYAIDAFSHHSPHKAFLLTTGRLLRCNPLFKGGVDKVETAPTLKHTATDTDHTR